MSEPRETGMTRHWSVTVECDCEQVVTIESNCLSGRDLSAEDRRIIRMAALHLQSFVGPEAEEGSLSPPEGLPQEMTTPELDTKCARCRHPSWCHRPRPHGVEWCSGYVPTPEGTAKGCACTAFVPPSAAADPPPGSPAHRHARKQAMTHAEAIEWLEALDLDGYRTSIQLAIEHAIDHLKTLADPPLQDWPAQARAMLDAHPLFPVPARDWFDVCQGLLSMLADPPPAPESEKR